MIELSLFIYTITYNLKLSNEKTKDLNSPKLKSIKIFEPKSP